MGFLKNKVPRAMLYLLKEGGQGIVDLKCRKAAFRLQFVKNFIQVKCIIDWINVLCKVGGWGLGKTPALNSI